MICEKLFKARLQEYVTEYSNKYSAKYSCNKYSLENISIEELQPLYDKISSELADVESNMPEPPVFDMQQAVEEIYDDAINDYMDKLSNLTLEKEFLYNKRKVEHEQALRTSHDTQLQAMQHIIDKHTRLVDWKEDIEDYIKRFNIKLTDVTITSNLTLEELNALLDTALLGCKIFKGTKKRNSKIMWLFSQNSLDFSITCLAAIQLIYIFLKGFIAPVFFGFFIYSVYRVHNNIEKLKIAESLLYNVDFEKYISGCDIAVDYSDIDAEYEEKTKELESHNPADDYDKDKLGVNAMLSLVTSSLSTAQSVISNLRKEFIADLKEKLVHIKDALEKYRSTLKPFGTAVSPNEYLDLNFVTGLHAGLIELRQELSLTNKVFNSRADDILTYLKLYIWNMLFNVKEGHMRVIIYDPANMGIDFSNFFTKKMQDVVQVVNTNLNQVVEELKGIVQQRIVHYGKEDIVLANKKRFELDMITEKHTLLVLASGVDEFMKIDNIDKFLSYSSSYGVFVWMLDAMQRSNCEFINEAFVGQPEPFPYTDEFVSRAQTTFGDALENSKPRALDYKTKFQDKYIPDDKIWTYSTIKGIELNVGLEDGDPTKGWSYVLGDENVSALMVGATGAGKSAAINEMLVTLLRKYPPTELQLIMVDFKNVEFSKMTDEDHYSTIPHSKILAGTKNGAYAISVFKFIYAELERRTKLFAEQKVVHIKDYREATGITMPRILCIIDEFQVMFKEVDQKSLDIIMDLIALIAKLMRFCGLHFWFTSQSMTGTLSGDILDQFTLRMALRCSQAASSSILGNKAASEITTKFGYMVTNDSGGSLPEKNVTWRVPYASPEYVKEQLFQLYDRAVANKVSMERVEFFDEERFYDKSNIYNLYKANNNFVDNPGIIIFGERGDYSTNRAPFNIILGRDTGEHLVVGCPDKMDLINFTLTMIDNFNCQPETDFILNIQDRETHTLMGADKLVNEDLADWTNPTMPAIEFFPILRDFINERKEFSPESLTPVYFIAVQWERADEICRNHTYKYDDDFKAILQEAPLVDIHFIFVCQTNIDFAKYIWQQCNHKLCAKSNETISFFFLESGVASKFKSNNYMIYVKDDFQSTFKLYQHEITGKLRPKEVIL